MTRLPDPDGARLRAALADLDPAPMPADVAARIGATLAEAQRAPEPHTEPGLRSGTGRLGRRPSSGSRRGAARRLRVALSAGLAAAALVAVFSASPSAGPRPVGEESELQAAGVSAVGTREAGPLTDPALRTACLAAAGVPEPGATLLGGRPYVVDGRPGTLLVLGTEVRGRFRLLVVEQGCGPAGGRVLAGATAGR